MAVTTYHTPIEAGALSVSGLQRIFDRLPAEARARIKWSPLETRTALTTFLNSARDEAALKELVAALIKQLQAIGPAVVELAAHPELFRSELEDMWRADMAALQQHIEPAAADAAEWVTRVWTAFMDLSLSVMRSAGPDLPRLMPDGDVMYLPGSPLRAQALMMAASESARNAGSPDLISDLIFRAFDEVVKLRQELQRGGIQLDPYRGETLAERAGRLRRYADYVRNSLSDSDMLELSHSRLRSLR